MTAELDDEGASAESEPEVAGVDAGVATSDGELDEDGSEADDGTSDDGASDVGASEVATVDDGASDDGASEVATVDDGASDDGGAGAEGDASETGWVVGVLSAGVGAGSAIAVGATAKTVARPATPAPAIRLLISGRSKGRR